MGAGAEIDEGALDRVARDDRSTLFLDEFDLERLAAIGEMQFCVFL